MPKFTPRSARFLSAPAVSSVVTDDAQTASILFEDLEVSIAGGSGRRPTPRSEFGMVTETVAISLEDNPSGTSVRHDLRGFVHLGRGTAASLTCLTGASVFPVTLPSAECDEEFDFSFESEVPEGAQLHILTLTLRVERIDPAAGGQALLQLDSIDLVLVEEAPKE